MSKALFGRPIEILPVEDNPGDERLTWETLKVSPAHKYSPPRNNHPTRGRGADRMRSR